MAQKSRDGYIVFLSTMDNGYQFLSNFYKCNVVVDGVSYRSTEHYYQSMKTSRDDLRQMIRDAPSPYYAKVIGGGLRKNDVAKDWESERVGVMMKGIRAKFTQNPELREKLLATGDAKLHEGNMDDKFWGMGGRDMLGKLLMELRSELRYALRPL
ncbi:MAG: NADAR family protein [Candidatus Micrarchaeota archaeon]|nr:NADAR family protein [Candidatus Micrarchaeota archaeon]MDE1834549.1 NADAR family protein [Candidatus Micrarchaeota archaeon]MDE1859783.1 NADAR family protein [Candidatus Micrarchaeota archaeon]